MFINQILTKLKSLVYSKSETDSLLNGKASSSHTHTKSQITDFPTIPSKVSQLTNDSGFITGVSWDSVSNKPSTFTPSSHTHTKSQITDFPSLATVATSGSYNDLSNKPSIPSIDLRPQASADANTVSDGVSITHYGSNGPATSLGASANDGALFQQCWSSAWKVQIAADYRNGNLFTRGKNNGTWQSWRAVAYHGDNVSKFTNDSGFITSSGSCNYANSAGNSDTLDGYHEYSFLRNRGSTSASGEGTLWAQIGIKQYNNALPDGLSGVYQWGEVVSLAGGNGRFEIYCSHQSSAGNGLYYRSGWDNNKKDWRCFIDSANIGSQSVNYATNSGYTNWLRTSSHADHLLHTEWDGSYFWTYVTAGDGGYRAVRVERSNSSGYADSAGGVAWGNVSGRPWALSQFTNDSGYITSEIDSSGIDSSGTGWVRFKCGVQICYGTIGPCVRGNTYNFSNAFNGSPFAVVANDIGPLEGANSAHFVALRIVDSTTFRFGCEAEGNIWIQYIAIGKWK